jgi:hypothetical protein
MKYLKLMGLAAIAAAALMAFAGTASATLLTNSSGATLGTGTTIAAENEGTVTLDPPFGAIECNESKVEGKTTNAGGTGVSVNGSISTLTFKSCNATVTVISNGTLSITGTGSNNGTLSSTGTEVTVEFFGTHCIFKTNNTGLGTVTGSTTTGGKTATLDISATIPRTGGRSGAFCGSTAAWTGAYKVTNPDFLNIDK